MFTNAAKIFIPGAYSVRTAYGTSRIGNREVVGHGPNGANVYKDDAHFPFPAIRFAESTRFTCALRLKEKGDWKMLSCEEKKALYRASFCQTFSEFQANTGVWRLIAGSVLFLTSMSFWFMTFFHNFVAEELPKSCLYENKKKQLRRMLELHTNPIDGLASTWNYDEDAWIRDVKGLIKKEGIVVK